MYHDVGHLPRCKPSAYLGSRLHSVTANIDPLPSSMKRSSDFVCVSRSTAILLVLSTLWVCICEIGVHYAYSSRWEWPQLELSGENLNSKELIRHDPPGVAQGLLASHLRHYQYEDIHYYTTESAVARGAITGEVGLRVLILSDPHIMCTFNR